MCFSIRFENLFSAEKTVACVAESGKNVTVFVELTIESGHVDFDVGMCLCNRFDAFGCADDIHKTDFLAAAVFEEFDCRHCTAACCEHRVEKNRYAVFDALGQLAIVFVRFEGFFVTVKADMSYVCGGEQSVDAVHHAKTCAENGDDGNRIICDHGLFGEFEGGLHHDFLGGNVLERLVDHESGDFFNEFAEFLHAGFFIAKDCDFVLNEGMIENGNVAVFFHF